MITQKILWTRILKIMILRILLYIWIILTSSRCIYLTTLYYHREFFEQLFLVLRNFLRSLTLWLKAENCNQPAAEGLQRPLRGLRQASVIKAAFAALDNFRIFRTVALFEIKQNFTKLLKFSVFPHHVNFLSKSLSLINFKILSQ